MIETTPSAISWSTNVSKKKRGKHTAKNFELLVRSGIYNHCIIESVLVDTMQAVVVVAVFLALARRRVLVLAEGDHRPHVFSRRLRLTDWTSVTAGEEERK